MQLKLHRFGQSLQHNDSVCSDCIHKYDEKQVERERERDVVYLFGTSIENGEPGI